MQKKVKNAKKKADKSSALARSLSARISPLPISQRFAPGSFDLEGILKRKAIDNQLLVAPKKLSMLSKANSMTGLMKSGLIKVSLKANSEKHNLYKEARSEVSPDRIIYINELKMKLREIKSENKKFKKELEGKKHKKKLWNFIDSFKSKLKSRLQQLT